MLLKYINDMPTFLKNLKVVNKRLQADLDCQVEIIGEGIHPDEVIILIPNELWETTYRISMITMVIRLCNYGYKYSDWESMWKDGAPSTNLDHAFSPNALKNAKNMGFTVPKKYEKYWWYCGDEWNNVAKEKQTGGMIHNNGVSSWSMYMKV